MPDLAIHCAVDTAVRPSQRVFETAAMFGLGVDDTRRLTIVPPTTVPLHIGEVVFITGPSGGGKSTVLRAIAQQARVHGMNVIAFDELPAPDDVPLVDVFDLPLERTTALLALAGLGDAFVMLRRPEELSDGQRYRLRLAQAMHLAQQHASHDSGRNTVVLADEFGATLDRLTARIIARNVRKWVRRAHISLICATTHDDLLESLAPDVLIYKGLGDELELVRRAE